MWVSTFHSLCARLLRREAPAIGLSRDFVIYDSSDQLTVVKQALKELHIDDSFVQPRAALSRISHAKNRMEGPEAMAAAAGWNRRDEQIAKIYALLPEGAEGEQRARFRRSAAQDRRALRAVRRACARSTREQFRFVMVDEYQDTNRPQYLLIRRLAEIHRNLCVVGDPDQSIYKWRGADLRNILDFEHGLPRSDDRQARAELPLDAGHPRRGVGRHQPEPQPQGQAPLDRPQGRRRDHLLPRRRRARGGRLHHAHRARRRWPTTSRRRSRCCIAPTRSRARSKTR